MESWILASGIGRIASSLRQRNFRLFWSGQMISLVGSAMQGVGQAWLVLELTHSALLLGLVGALQALPLVFCSIPGGMLADRWPRWRVLLITQSAALVQAFLVWLLLVTGTFQLWHLYILAVLLGITNSLDLPTRQAFVVELVGRGELPNAVALNSAASTLARIIGPALGGIIIAVRGVTLLFLLNALSFLAVILGLGLMTQSELHSQRWQAGSVNERQRIRHSLSEGIAYTWKTPMLLWVIVGVGLVLLFGSNFNVVLPLIARDVLHEGARGYGLLSAAFGIGALLATLWLAWGNRRVTGRRLWGGMLIFGIVEAVFAVSQSYLLSLLLIACVGFMEATFTTQAMALLQSLPPEHLRGRVASIQVLFFDGSLPLGYLLMGGFASLCGPSTALLLGAVLSLLIGGGSWLCWTRVREDSIEF